MSAVVNVYCKGRGEHGRIDFPALIIEGDEVRERLSRTRPAPWGSGATLKDEGDELAAPLTYTDVAKAHLEHDAAGRVLRGRWLCPRCRRDVQVSAARLLPAVRALGHAGDPLDVSMIPT